MPRPATKTVLVLLALPLENGNKTYKARIIAPNKQSITIVGNGPNELKGKFQDEGYTFGKVKTEIPDWIFKLIESQYYIIGVADVLGFPMKK